MSDRLSTSPPRRFAELLAPAGDWEAMRAAVLNGADAVYFGLGDFNARYRATNFTMQELPQVMRYLHDHNVRGFVTLNTLIFSDELPRIAEYVRAVVEASVDAVIVQDLGLVRLMKAIAPDLEIHASTQMTLTEPRGLEFARQLGVERAVLPRETTLDEIRRITAGSTLPVEVFVHGALCMSYSGQCLTSEAIGGRSANRGQCAQACRLPYELIVDGQKREMGDVAYLLSPKDLAAYDLIGDLLDAGVISFKIEGRLKSAEYVAAATQTYRAAVDAALTGRGFQISDDQFRGISQSFSRGFSHGFLSGLNHQQLVHGRFPKSRGMRIGLVSGLAENTVTIDIDRDCRTSLKPGDGVVFDEGHPEQDEQGGRIFAVEQLGRGRVRIAFPAGQVNDHALAIGAIVWKTDDPKLRRQLEVSYARERVIKRSPVTAHIDARIGQPLELTLRDEDGHSATARWEGPLEAARKHPATRETIREQLARLGDTPLELTAVHATALDAVMIPKSVLNDLRRQAADELLRQRAGARRVSIVNADALFDLRNQVAAQYPPPVAHAATSHLTVMARSVSQVEAILRWTKPDEVGQRVELSMIYCDYEDLRRYKQAVDMCRDVGVPVGLATLRILKPQEEGLNNLILKAGPDAVLCRNLASMSYFAEHAPQIARIGDYALNITNEITAAVLAASGLHRLTPSYDLNMRQFENLAQRFDPTRMELVVHQHMPMFHMEHCVFAHTLSTGKDYHDCGRPCDHHQVNLRDRAGVEHPLLPDTGCRNTLYNGVAQSAAVYIPRMQELGVRWFRMELLREDAADTTALLDRYARLLAGIETSRGTTRQLNILAQFGVSAGTFDHD